MKYLDKIIEAAEKFKEEFNKIIELPAEAIEKIVPGQVWKVSFKVGDSEEFLFAVTTSEAFKELEEIDEAVRILPIFLSPLDECICPKTDLIIEPDKFPTQITSLLEWWNERPIETSQLKSFFGELSKDQLDQVNELLKEHPNPINKTENLFLFREEEIAKGSLISQLYFSKLWGYINA